MEGVKQRRRNRVMKERKREGETQRWQELGRG